MSGSRLILARHGNTFRPEDEPVWVGARSDLPLVEKGLAQARDLGEMLRKTSIIPHTIIAGPLQRTQETAIIVADLIGMAARDIKIDARLTELDYGTWEGKSTGEIIKSGFEAEMTAWNKQSIFPVNAGWSPSEAQIKSDIGAIMSEMKNGISLIITSNGILRFFARVAANAHAFPDLKTGTGNLCIMEYTAKAWHILAWNQPPERFLV